MLQVITAESFPYPTFRTKADRLAWFRVRLSLPEWAVWGLGVVFTYQTAQEQASEQTAEDNGVGFTGADGAFLSSLAKQWAKNARLSEKQLAVLSKRMPRYAAQLAGHLERSGVAFAFDPDAPEASAVPPQPPVPASVVFGDAEPPTPAKPKGDVDWPLYHKLIGMSNVANQGEVNRYAYVSQVENLLPPGDAFARDVWKSCLKRLDAGAVPTYGQAKCVALACAKASARQFAEAVNA